MTQLRKQMLEKLQRRNCFQTLAELPGFMLTPRPASIRSFDGRVIGHHRVDLLPGPCCARRRSKTVAKGRQSTAPEPRYHAGRSDGGNCFG